MAVIFRALWWIVAQKNGVSALGLQRVLGIGSFDAAWSWLHKFRRLMVIPGRKKLSGVVEIDETFVGGRKSGKRGRGAQGKVLVAIAVEVKGEATGRVRLAIIRNASAKSLRKFIESNVELGSNITTDGWRGYNRLTQWGYSHTIEEKTKSLDGEEILPNVHRIAALLKRWLLGTHQAYVSNEHLAYYLDEFTFRHNRRRSNSRGLLFQTLINQAVTTGPIPYSEIVANPLHKRIRKG
jgi:transposase-like protein